jgi:hypothetical protein
MLLVVRLPSYRIRLCRLFRRLDTLFLAFFSWLVPRKPLLPSRMSTATGIETDAESQGHGLTALRGFDRDDRRLPPKRVPTPRLQKDR